MLSQEFFAPIRQLKERIPHIALQEINNEFQKRAQIILDYITVLKRYDLENINKQKNAKDFAKELRQQIRADRRQVRAWKRMLERSENRIIKLLATTPI